MIDAGILQGRTDYVLGSLSEETVHPSPKVQFEAWLAEAVANGVLEPNAMTLATSDEEGRPSARIVLLRGIDDRGLRFFTNYGSRKAKELEGERRAAALFFWPSLERQVRVEGVVRRLPVEESAAYFASRPRESQLGAWASRQSELVASRAELEAALAKMEERFAGQEVPLPDFWGGYVLSPVTFEFWQGGRSRLHDRVVYTRSENAFSRQRLFP